MLVKTSWYTEVSFFSFAWVLVPWSEMTPTSSAVRPPHSESSTERSNSVVVTRKHAVGGKSVLFLSFGLALDGCNSLSDKSFLGLGRYGLELEFEEFVLVLDPLSNLLATEGKLAGAVLKVEDRSVGLGLNLATNGEDTLSGSRNRSPSLVTARSQLVTASTKRRECTYVEVEVKATIPRIVQPISMAVFALMMT